ncbi:CRE-SCAV-3 protein [Aphelenchoides avenae]|nr:CRE-SCAV-3 protein [Aphelenchus avenae]
MGEPQKTKFNFKRWHIVAAVAILIAVVVCIMSVALLIFLPDVVEKNIRSPSSKHNFPKITSKYYFYTSWSSNLAEDGPIYDKWMHPNYDVKSNIWTYSVTNPDQVVNGSVPTVKSTGPYVYDQKFKRRILARSNNSITYEVNKTYFFDEENSCAECFPYNRIWIPNLIYQKFVEAASKPAMKAALPALMVQTPFLEIEVGGEVLQSATPDVKVSEILFGGYKDPFLHKVCELPFVNFICDSMLDLPGQDRLLLRGMLVFQKNGTSTGTFEINTGEANENDLGQLISYNGKKTVPDNWWSTPSARMINGTDGNLFKPYISKDENITVFVSDMSLDLVYQKEIDYAGITAYRYVVTYDALNFDLPENAGFCVDNGKEFFPGHSSKCLPNGLLDISRCQRGDPPVVISWPNFLFSPDYVQESIRGMPKPDLYRDQIEARRRFQINVAMWRGINLTMPGFDLSRFKNSIVPVLKIDEAATIDFENLQLIKDQLIHTEAVVRFAASCAAVTSLLSIAITLIYISHRKGHIERAWQSVRRTTRRIRPNGATPNGNQKMGRKALVWTYRICLIAGSAFVALGLGLLFLLPGFVTKQVAKEDYLGRDGNGTYNMMFKKWQKPEYSMLFEVWTFDVENSADVLKSGSKPHLRQKGPYVFIESQEKKWFEFEQNDTRIFYRNSRQYTYNESLSCANCSLSDKVTVPNILFQKLVDVALTGKWVKFAIEEALKIEGETAFITVSVGELLFEGYKDPLVSSICDHNVIKPICTSYGVPDRIGLFYGQNNTDDGAYEVDTGLNGARDIGRVYSWNNMTKLSAKYWYGSQARMINGTDGQLFKPQIQSGEELPVFTGQICRSIALDHVGEAKIQDVPTYRYSPSASTNDMALQKAMGFCNPNSPEYFNDTTVQPKGCSPQGIMDISSCVPSSPRIYVSQPMFLDAPKALRDATFIDIEPVSGVVVQALRRSQLNVGTLHGNLDMLKNLKTTIVPIIWMNETALFDQDTRDELHRLTTVSTTANVASGIFIIFGVLLVVAAAGAFALEQVHKKREMAVEPDALQGEPTGEQERAPLVPPAGYEPIATED